MATITAQDREKFLQLMQDYNKSLENKTEVEVISANQMDDTVSMPGVKGSIDPLTGEFRPEKYVQAPMSAFAKPALDAAELVAQRKEAFETAISNAEIVLQNMQNATENARSIVSTAEEAAESVRQTLEALRGVEVNANQLALDVERAGTLLTNLSDAIQQAQLATSNANNQAEYAKDEGDYAKEQGDYAKGQGNRVDSQILDITTQKQAAIEAADNANSIYQTVRGWFNGANGFKLTSENWLFTIQTTWNNWFSDSLSTGVRKIWNTWFSGRQTEWSNWFSDSLATGVRNIWNTWFGNTTSNYDLWFSNANTAEQNRVTAENGRVNAEQNRVTAEQNRVTAENQRVAEMEELHQHPDIQGNNGNWWRWDMSLTPHQYVDTGVLAKGGILYPSFEVDTNDMGLYMYGSSEETSESFSYDESDGAMYYNPRKGKITS